LSYGFKKFVIMKKVSITKAVKIKNQRVKPFNEEKEYLATGGLIGNKIKTEAVTYKTKPSRADLLVTENQLIIARMKETNKVLLINKNTNDLIVSTGFLVLDVQEGWHPGFLFHYFVSNFFQEQKDRLSIGATQKAINNDKFKEILIPELSFEDQKRIVKILDEADALRQKRKQAIGLLDDYLKSVFLEMFGDLSKNKNKWEFIDFGKYIALLTDYHANGSYEVLKKNVTLLSEPDYALMVRTTDLENNNFTTDVKYIDQHAYNFLEKSKVFGNEIIINKIGSAGKVYLMPKLNRPVSLGMNAFLLRFKDNVNINFIYYLLTSAYGEAIIQKKVKGAVTKTIRKDAVKSLRVPNIPIELQDKFSLIYEESSSIKQKMIAQSEELKNQFQTLMQKAFKGQL